MRPAEALEAMRGYAGAWRFEIGPHAWKRMRQRNATEYDVRHGLMTAKGCVLQTNGRWLVDTADLDDDALELVVVFEDGVVVVTLF